MKYRSIAYWPSTVSVGNDENKSTDTHPTFEAAASVIARLKIDGFGGEGKIFPISTHVEKVE